MASPPFLCCAQALFSARLLHHELHKLLERQRRSVKPFEREGFEKLGALDDDPRLLFGRHLQGDALASEGLPDVIVFEIDAHGALAADGAHHRQAVADLQPAIRVDQVRHRRQFGQGRKSGARRTVATPESLVGTLVVVVLAELRGDLAHLVEGPRTFHGQTFLLVRPMVALDKAVLLGMVRIADPDRHAQAVTEAHQARSENRCPADC